MILKTHVKPGPSTAMKLKQIWTQFAKVWSLSFRQDRLFGWPVKTPQIVTETGKEKVSDLEERVRKLFTEKLQLDYLKIELDWAHRTGKPTSSEKPRPIVVRFPQLKDKLAVLDKAKNLKGSGILINEDFPEAVQQKRKELLPPKKAAWERGDIAYLRYNCSSTYWKPITTEEDQCLESGLLVSIIWHDNIRSLLAILTDSFIIYVYSNMIGITYDASKPTKKG